MKMAMWLLLALNGLAAAVWLAGFSVPPKPVVELTVSTPSAKPLQLLSELPALPPRLDTLPADSGLLRGTLGEGVTPPTEVPVETPGVQTPIAEPEVAPAPVVESPAQLAATAGSTVSIKPEPPAAIPSKPSVPVAPQPPADASAAPVTTDLSGGPICYRTPALASDAYEAAGMALRGADLGEPTLQPQDRARPRHWVYWSGAPDELAGIEERLKTAGVRDWYRLRTPDGMQRISLGVYGQADGARRRQRELAAKAIRTQISERYTPQARLRWIVTAQPEAVEAAKDRLQGQGVRLEACP